MSACIRVPQRMLPGTELTLPALAFGAGPVSALMTDPAARERQLATVRRALALGVDWFDTAATYGHGESERSMSWALRELGSGNSVRIGTKVRLATEQLADILGSVRASVEGSLHRLGVDSVALLQLHNSITRQRGDQPTSITPDDVLRSGGILEAFAQLRREGLIQHFGLTGLGDEASLNEVLNAEPWATMQVNLNLCDRSAGLRPRVGGVGSAGNSDRRPALLAIRVFAGGALAGRLPSAHTLTTKFFPLPIYERDLRRAELMRRALPSDVSLPEAAVRFAAHHPHVTSAIVGFGSPEEVEDAVRWAVNGPLPDEVFAKLDRAGV